MTRSIGLLLLLTLMGGCVRGSLASSTGPSAPGFHWSTASRQMVHVGEEVRFDFVLHDARKRSVSPLGLADYCVTYLDGERVEIDSTPEGHFSFSHKFDGVQPGDRVVVEVTAFRQRGGRDFMRIQGIWMHNDSPYDKADKPFRRDAIRFEVYETPIELTLVRPADDLDLETGVLRLRGGDDRLTRIMIDKPNRPGFTISGPGSEGYYRIHYLPTGSELNPSGVTEVEFAIHDVNHQLHEVRTTIETP